jgi:hypothetical protein
MTGQKQIGGLFGEGRTKQLVAELVQYRSDVVPSLVKRADADPVLAASLSVLRLQELDQTLFAVYRSLLKTLLAHQKPDGSFGDAALTAMAIRALLDEPSASAQLARAIDALSRLQRTDGAFVLDAPLRMPGDLPTTATVLYHLARDVRCARILRIEAAARWLIDHSQSHSSTPSDRSARTPSDGPTESLHERPEQHPENSADAFDPGDLPFIRLAVTRAAATLPGQARNLLRMCA